MCTRGVQRCSSWGEASLQAALAEEQERLEKAQAESLEIRAARSSALERQREAESGKDRRLLASTNILVLNGQC
jgi:hypothetical protein